MRIFLTNESFIKEVQRKINEYDDREYLKRRLDTLTQEVYELKLKVPRLERSTKSEQLVKDLECGRMWIDD